MIRQTFLFLLCITFAVPAVAEDEAAVYRRLTDSQSAALVTVKFLLRMEGQFGKRESETEITGIMIDAKGLILCANSKLGAPRRFGSATPTDIKVLIGDDIDGLPAKVLARDTELDLAWVQIKEPGEKTFEFMNMADPGEPQIGDRLYALRRMAKFFDRTRSSATVDWRAGRRSRATCWCRRGCRWTRAAGADGGGQAGGDCLAATAGR